MQKICHFHPIFHVPFVKILLLMILNSLKRNEICHIQPFYGLESKAIYVLGGFQLEFVSVTRLMNHI